jgi:hypothetical protein
LRRLEEQLDGKGRLPSVAHLFGNVYAVGGTCIISRTATAHELRQLRRRAFRQIVYVIDDDFEAGAVDPLLPASYRAKLAAFAAGPWLELKAMADVVVASSPVLANLYGSKTRVVQPAWRRQPAGFGHFERPSTFEIAHIGTASHTADYAMIRDEVGAILAAHPHVRLTLFGAAKGPDDLRGLPQVRIRRPMAWWRYKLVVPRLRFHLAIYPLRDSGFNAARSANKLFEHALVGAASLMTPNPALRAAAGPDLDDVFVDGSAAEWRDRIFADLQDQAACRDRAARTRARISEIAPLDEGADQWREILAMDGGSL